ncbi:unnamed protein product [Eruca vesicaria subsp. sativa]|uniref:Uncharacterized protein n=1 Tax=Eruca vesicaria subsp. sativa TaxID=29727 RepID=A0ABC8KB40_ERUVS|nr:unnamed protein product [Eruca vesicaria subsp. sativa]
MAYITLVNMNKLPSLTFAKQNQRRTDKRAVPVRQSSLLKAISTKSIEKKVTSKLLQTSTSSEKMYILSVPLLSSRLMPTYSSTRVQAQQRYTFMYQELMPVAQA